MLPGVLPSLVRLRVSALVDRELILCGRGQQVRQDQSKNNNKQKLRQSLLFFYEVRQIYIFLNIMSIMMNLQFFHIKDNYWLSFWLSVDSNVLIITYFKSVIKFFLLNIANKNICIQSQNNRIFLNP